MGVGGGNEFLYHLTQLILTPQPNAAPLWNSYVGLSIISKYSSLEFNGIHFFFFSIFFTLIPTSLHFLPFFRRRCTMWAFTEIPLLTLWKSAYPHHANLPLFPCSIPLPRSQCFHPPLLPVFIPPSPLNTQLNVSSPDLTARYLHASNRQSDKKSASFWKSEKKCHDANLRA